MRLSWVCMLLISNMLFAQEDGEKISIYLNWSHQFQFAGYYAAVEKGFYAEEGLDVALVAGATANGIQRVLDGEYEYGIGPGALLLSHSNVEEIRILAAIFQKSPISLLTLKNSNINTLSDLEGKSITGGTEIKAMLATGGVDLDAVNFGPISTDFTDLATGSYDAISYYITDKARKLGPDSLLYNTFRPIEYGINFYGDCLFTSFAEAARYPDRVQRMYRATIKGWQYAINNRDEIIDIILDKYPSGWKRHELQIEADITIHTLIQSQFYDIGDMQVSKWQQTASILKELGILRKEIDIDNLLIKQDSESYFKYYFGIMGILLVVTAVSISLMFLYNRQLKKSVSMQTSSLKKANLEMDKFVYSVSHDIRSPLLSIQGIVNLMRSDPAGSHQYIDLIEKSVQRLNHFTGDILDYSRNSRSAIRYKTVDFEDMVDKIWEDMQYLAGDRTIKLVKNFRSNTKFRSDAWRLEVMLGNIFSNSLKYRDPSKEINEVRVDVSIDTEALHCQIADNGIGIGEEHMDKIYDMFYRATERSQGSGIGLYLVKETVSMLKGTIELQSKVGEGTTITFSVPNKL